jgi:hypothetical protein
VRLSTVGEGAACTFIVLFLGGFNAATTARKEPGASLSIRGEARVEVGKSRLGRALPAPYPVCGTPIPGATF